MIQLIFSLEQNKTVHVNIIGKTNISKSNIGYKY